MKLTPKDIVEIKCALSRNVPKAQIARIFKVSDVHICRIADNKVEWCANIGNAPTWNLHDTVNEVL